MLRNYVLTALRNLRKHLGYSIINIFGLGLGLATALLLALWIRHELSYDNFHQNADDLYRVSMEMSIGGQSAKHAVSPTALLPALQKNFPEVRSGVRIYNPSFYSPFIVKKDDKVFQEEKFYFADSTFFKVLSFPLVNGDIETVLKNPNTVVLTQSAARKYFGESDPIGQTLTINGNKEYLVTGVARDLPSNSYLHFDFVGSFSSLRQASEEIWWSANYLTFIQLEKGASVASLEEKTNDLVKEALQGQLPGADDYVKYNWLNIQKIHLQSEALTEMEPVGNIQYVYLFAGIALLIIFIACINYINLATARASYRAKEVGVRKVIGASKQQLTFQFIGESFIITSCALVFAFLLAQLLLPLFDSLTGKAFGYESLFDPSFLSITLLVALLIALGSGAYPAWAITSFKPVQILKGNFRTSGKGVWLRKSLVVFQFSITMVLSIATLAITKQLSYIQNKELGYSKDNTILIPLDRQTQDLYSTLKTEFLRSGKVTSLARTQESPVEVRGGYSMKLQESSDPAISIVALSTDHEFVPTLEMEIVAGRNFNETDIKNHETDTTYAFMLNETALKSLFLEKEEAIGKQVDLNGRKGEVVGVVKDFHFASLHMPVGPLAIFNQVNEYNYAIAKLAPGSLTEALQTLEEISKEVAPHRPFHFEFLDQQFDGLYRSEQLMGNLFGVFVTLAIVIASLGLLGLVSFSATQKTKEIGIRKVLGATTSSIVLLITNEYTKLVLIATVIGVPVALYLVQLMLSNFAYTTSIGIVPIAVSAFACLAIALSTASYQALKAAFINPSDTLRSE
ncbi:MAG: FtsX-like permease family protein [Cytophagales bacterium]